jgi:hypothetical protein
MISLESEHRLIHSLTPAEKRFVRLVGSAVAGQAGSNQLVLFGILNRMKAYDHATCEKQKTLVALGDTVRTLARRLRKLILKCLQQVGSERSVSCRLSLQLHETEFLFHRQQIAEAQRSAQNGWRLAQKYGRYEWTLTFTDWQRRMLLHTFPPNAMQRMEELNRISQQAHAYLTRQLELRRLQELLTAERRTNTSPRPGSFRMMLENIAQHEALRDATYPDLLTESLAEDVRGMLLLATGKGQDALEVYSALLKRCQHEPEWIRESPDQYLALFKNYQLAVFWGTLSNKKMQSYLALLPREEELPPKSRLDFQRIRHSHLLTLGLNTGKFGLVLEQIPLIVKWLKENRHQLPVSAQLSFHYNICITYFLSGDYREAYRSLQPVLQHKGRGEREDILDFARVLQAVLLYQSGDDELSEYLVRSARKFFRRNPRQWAFEEAVLRYLDLSLTAKNKKALERLGASLSERLVQFAHESGGSYPLLGLVEIQCWLQSHRSGKHIRDVFTEKLVQSED